MGWLFDSSRSDFKSILKQHNVSFSSCKSLDEELQKSDCSVIQYLQLSGS